MLDFRSIHSVIRQQRARIDSDKGAREMLQRQLSELNSSIEVKTANIGLYDDCLIILEVLSKTAHATVLKKVEDVVKLALQFVYGSEYDFELLLSTHAGAPSVEFVVKSPVDGELLSFDPRNGRGGGVAEVVGLALRIALLELYVPRISGPIILDEPCAKVDTKRAVHVARFLKLYSERMHRQIILITHQPAFSAVADRRFTVSTNATGQSEVFIDEPTDAEAATEASS